MKKGFMVLFLAAALSCFFTMPSWAVDFKAGAVDLSLGGSVQLNTALIFSDYGDVEAGAADDKTEFDMELPNDACLYLGAASGKLSAYIELGLDDGSPDLSDIYATYALNNSSSLLFGKTDSCFSEDSPMEVLNNANALAGFGDMYIGSAAQIRFTHTLENLTIQAAIEDNKIPDVIEETLERYGDPYVVETLTPALVLGLGIEAGQLSITPSLYMQQFTLKANTTGRDDIDLTAYALAINGTLKTGDIILSGEIWMGQNTALFSDVATQNRDELEGFFGAPAFNTAYTDADDVSSMGFWGQITVPVKPGTLRVGLGYQQADVENDGAAYESEVETMGFFINYEHPIAENFTITPELCYHDFGNAPLKDNDGQGGNDLGSDITIGVHFQYDF